MMQMLNTESGGSHELAIAYLLPNLLTDCVTIFNSLATIHYYLRWATICIPPRAVILGPPTFQGKQLINYKIYQYTSYLVRFVGYLRENDDIGNLVCIQMNQHQLLIGSSKYFLEVSNDDYPYGESSRIKFLCEHNTLYKITLHVQWAWKQMLIKQHDVFLMDRICNTIRQPDVLV